MENLATNIYNAIPFVILFGVCIWVMLDAQSIRDDGGRLPGAVDIRPGFWAAGTFLLLILVLPIYLIMRVGYKKQLEKKRAELLARQSAEEPSTDATVWPPPPSSSV